MKIGVIDMGTNTFHLLVADVEGTEYRVLERERVAVRIGKGGISDGFITEDSIGRALDTLVNFKKKMVEVGVNKVFATATSAVRSAKNGQELVNRICEATGIEVKVISGDEEAEAIYYGVSKALSLGSEKSLIMDVGGGSIEFIIGNQDQIFWKRSFEMGGQRLLDRFHKSDPIDESELSSLLAFIKENLGPLIEAARFHKPKILVGSSGTFDTLSDIFCEKRGLENDENATEYPLTVEGFLEIFQDLKSMNRVERLKIPGMIEMRVDMIVVASVLVYYIIDQLGIDQIRVSSYALKEGILMKTIDDLQVPNQS